MPKLIQKAGHGRALANEDTFATCLLAILLKNFGVEMFEWEPETLELETSAAFPNIDMPAINVDQVGALVTALTTDQFYLYFEMYSNVCRALCGEESDFADFAMPTPRELAWGVMEVTLSDVDDKGKPDRTFSPEIANFTGFVLEEHGVYNQPEILKFAEYVRPNPVLSGDDTFSTDGDMFKAAVKNQRLQAISIDNYVNERATLLKAQLADLELIDLQPPTH